jgi:hypothetical protein
MTTESIEDCELSQTTLLLSNLVNQLKSALEKIADSKYWWHENGQPKEFLTPDAHEARKTLEQYAKNS